MPELSVTEEQLERLEALRTELESTFVDGYAHVRRRDAVDYLLDTYTPPAEHAEGTDGAGENARARPGDPAELEERVRDALDGTVRDGEGDIEYTALQSVARDTEGVKGSGMGAEEMYEAVLEAKIREAKAGETDGFEIPETDGADAGGSDGTDADGDAVEADPEPADADGEGVDADEEGGDPDGATDGNESADQSDSEGSGTSSTATASSNGGGSPLQAMMNLLETHDDKWRKAESGDAPYEVDLPDGGTEPARTKDDVKRILFTNY